MTLEEARIHLEQLKKDLSRDAFVYGDFDKKVAIDIVLQALDNSISKDEVINKMEEMNKAIKNAEPIDAVFMIKQQQALHELLMGE